VRAWYRCAHFLLLLLLLLLSFLVAACQVRQVGAHNPHLLADDRQQQPHCLVTLQGIQVGVKQKQQMFHDRNTGSFCTAFCTALYTAFCTDSHSKEVTD